MGREEEVVVTPFRPIPTKSVRVGWSLALTVVVDSKTRRTFNKIELDVVAYGALEPSRHVGTYYR